MRRLADAYNVPLHLDGARLWEIAPFYAAESGVSVVELVALFDSAYVSFYKGLGALTGAMLLGRASFVDQARVWRRRLGANPYTVFPYAISCRDVFRLHADTFEARWAKLRTRAPRCEHPCQRPCRPHDRPHDHTRRPHGRVVCADACAGTLVPQLGDAARGAGGVFRTLPPVPQCCQVQACVGFANGRVAADVAILDAARDAVEVELGVRVYHRLAGPAPSHAAATRTNDADGADEPPLFFFEWCLGPSAVAVDDGVFVAAWTAFFREVRQQTEVRDREDTKNG